jgi:hypothetical protein
VIWYPLTVLFVNFQSLNFKIKDENFLVLN